MQSHRPTKTTQSDILDDPLDGYPNRQPFYVLAFLLLRRLQAEPDKPATAESDGAYFYLPDDLKRLPR